jgi:hypothetical protein
MKSLKDYITEAEETLGNPQAGDVFMLEFLPDQMIETIVSEITDDAIILEMDAVGMKLLAESNLLLEDGNSPAQMAATDSTSPINGSIKKKQVKVPDTKLSKRPQPHKEVNAEISDYKDKMDEAKYHGRTVKLGKPFLTPDGPKKRSVYVKNAKGNVVKVNFGSKEMRIKKSNPARRKNFRARHRCSNPGPRWKARYWSCRAW